MSSTIKASHGQLFFRRGTALSKCLFFVSFGLWFAASILILYSSWKSAITPYISLESIRLFCFALLIAREIVFGKWGVKPVIGLALFAFMGYMTYLGALSIVLDSLVFVFAARDIPLDDIARFVFAELVVLTAFVVTSALIGLVPDITTPRSDTGLRHFLGLNHPNRVGAHVLYASCIWAYIRRKSFGVPDAIGILAVTLVTYYFIQSRTMLALAVLLIAAMATCRLIKSRKVRRVLESAGIFTVAVVALCSFLLVCFYDSQVGWMATLDKIISGRLSSGHLAFAKYGFDFFGRNVDLPVGKVFDLSTGEIVRSAKPLIVDSAYAYCPLRFGILFSIVIIVLTTLACWKIEDRYKLEILAIIAIIALQGVTEKHCIVACYNIFLFAIGHLFSGGTSLNEILLAARKRRNHARVRAAVAKARYAR